MVVVVIIIIIIIIISIITVSILRGAIPGQVVSDVSESNALQCWADELSFVRLNNMSTVHE